MREGVVIPFDNVVESKSGAVIAGDGEADGVGPVVIRKTAAGAAGVAEIAERPQSGGVGLPGMIGRRAAGAGWNRASTFGAPPDCCAPNA